MKVLATLLPFPCLIDVLTNPCSDAFRKSEKERLTALSENLGLRNTVMKLREHIATFETESILLKAMLDSEKAGSEASKLRIAEMRTRQNQLEVENNDLRLEASTSCRQLQEHTREIETLRERVASMFAKVQSTCHFKSLFSVVFTY